MAGSIHLIAYPDWRRSDVRKWHDAMFSDTGVSKPGVALFTAPGGDDPEEIAWLTKTFRQTYGAAVHPVRLVRQPISPADARAIIREAHLLYFTGGDHFVLVHAARNAGIEVDLRKRHREGAVVGAYSAGAIAIGPYWPEWPEPERPDLPEEGAGLVKCLGLNRHVICDFHGESDDWDELHACMRLIHNQESSAVWNGYGVPTRGAIRISKDGQIERLGDHGPWLVTTEEGVKKIPGPASSAPSRRFP